MDSENRHRFDRQRARKQELLDEQMIELGERRLQLQGIPVNNPDPVPKRSWVKGKTHGRANTRGLTANELGQRRQRQQGRQQAQEARIQEEDFIQQLHQAAASQDPFDSQFTTISVAPARSEQLLDRASERPRTPPQISQTLPIRTPTTTERPRRRKTPSPEPSPEPSPLPTSAYELPTSTAPPKLGREKRKRVHTARYQEAKETGQIAESQEAHKADRQG